MATEQALRGPGQQGQQGQPEALLQARGVSVDYAPPGGGAPVHAVRDVDVTLRAGELVGLVGESGCGKSTLGYALTRMVAPPAHLVGGSIVFDGRDVARLDGEELRRARPGGFALVLQSGMNSLSPVRTVLGHVGDVLRAHGRVSRAQVRERAREVVHAVLLEDDVLDRYPHELSGGMRQRVALALALALAPRLVVLDEPTTALDVLVQQGVMATIAQLQRDEGFTALLISHDLGVVLESAHRVLVMYAGRVVEDCPAGAVLTGEHHPYTEALLRCYADPRAEHVELEGIPGAPPDLREPPPGCAFADRCPLVVDACRLSDPPLVALGPARVACHVRAPQRAGSPRGADGADGADGARAADGTAA